MNIVLFGPPGAGKGTQSQFIAKKYNLYQISTGDLLRNEIKNKTEIGNEIEKIIAEGDFATDVLFERRFIEASQPFNYLMKLINSPSLFLHFGYIVGIH